VGQLCVAISKSRDGDETDHRGKQPYCVNERSDFVGEPELIYSRMATNIRWISAYELAIKPVRDIDLTRFVG